MRHIFFLLTLILILSSCSEVSKQTQQDSPNMKKIDYPVSSIDTVSDNYFGQEVKDPYRWLEDNNSKQTKDWVAAQNIVSQSLLTELPQRAGFRARLEELWNYPKQGAPQKVGEYSFTYRNNGLQNQAVIYRQQGLDGKAEVFLDPNTLNSEGTSTQSIVGHSKDGKYITIDRSDAGSDWSTFTIMETSTGKLLPDELKWVKFSGASWYQNGFFYSRYPAPNEGGEYSDSSSDHSVYYHKLGDDQADDKLVYRNLNNDNNYHWVNVTEDENYLILYAASGTDGFECYFKDLSEEGTEFKPLFLGFENKSKVIAHVAGSFLVHTDIDAPNYRLVSIPTDNHSPEAWIDVVPSSEHLLESVNTGGGKLFLNYLEGACNKLYVAELDGSDPRYIALPGAGSASTPHGETEDEVLFFSYTSYNYPTTIFKYDIKSSISSIHYQPKVDFNPEDFVTKQLKFKSKDGTEVSMFVVHAKSVVLDGNNPTLLYGYGGFNISLSPAFSTSNIAFLEQGGVYAVANLRGGGEYGESWHRDGMLSNKQNVFDDFIAAAEYLIAQGYTSSQKLAIEGRSNGGLLVGACMTQRPDLFAVAFPGVGVMDMLRYHRFTVGWGWIPEYGCADSTKIEFENLFSYSPYHNLKEGTQYPATMVTTADHDDRVVPAHSYKFAAKLQACHVGTEPVLIRIDVDAGHGAGKPTSKVLDELADKWAFMFENMAVNFQK